jgi:hypothetical protein
MGLRTRKDHLRLDRCDTIVGEIEADTPLSLHDGEHRRGSRAEEAVPRVALLGRRSDFPSSRPG